VKPLFLLPALVGIAACSSPASTLADEAHAAVKAQLRDPASALFDQEQPALLFPEQGLACGRVNSKNGFGGYAGAEMYAYARSEGAQLASGDLEAFERLHNRCLAALGRQTDEIKARTAKMKTTG
jgi:hypothetical protein